MFRSFFSLAILLSSCATAWAGPMPVLPDLPPLPEDYATVGGMSGPYVGILGGLSMAATSTGKIGIVAGTALVDDVVVIGVEALGLMGGGSASLEAGVRLGLPLNDHLALATQASLGMDSIDGGFLGLGGSLDVRTGDALTWRLQYRHAFDLTGDAGKDLVMLGVVFNF